VGSRTAEASVTVHPGDSLPIDTIRGQAPKAPRTFKAKQIIIAVPSSGRTPLPVPTIPILNLPSNFTSIRGTSADPRMPA
jgi:hypothetical protein